MRYLIGLDIGTSSVKGALMSEERDVVATVTKKHQYEFADGIKQMNAEEFCDNCFAVIRELAERADGEVLAVSASGASGNLMTVGKQPSPIFGWQTEFTDGKTAELLNRFPAEEVYRIVGWPKLNSFPLAGLCYLRANRPVELQNAEKICMSIEYLGYRLTGKWGITRSMGTPFYLIDQEKGEYCKAFLDTLGIPAEKLPPILSNGTVLGTITARAAAKTGLTEATVYVPGTFDHPAAAIGSGVSEEGDVLLSCGTSWVVLVPYRERSAPMERQILTDPFLSPDGCWCGMKALTSIAERIASVTERYLGDISCREADALAEQSVPGAGGLEINLHNPAALPSDTEKRHIARGIYEAAARELKGSLDALGVSPRRARIVGGITNAKIWVDVISQVCGFRAEVVNGECAGAAGSAIMAGVGAGVFSGIR